MNNETKRSRIYSYFYGSNTGFQQFLIIAGIFLLLATSVASTASRYSYNKICDKYYEASSEYNDYYWEYGWALNVDEYEEATNPDEGYEDEMKEYNAALKKYNKALSKWDEGRSKFLENTFPVLGFVSLLTGVLWFLIKKLTFNKSGEDTVDEEIALCMENAKAKGLEKLNLVAEQVETVEPIVLNGVAYPGSSGHPRDNFIVRFFKSIFMFILRFDKIIIGLLASLVLTAILTGLAANGWPVFLLLLVIIAVVGYSGYIFYKTYEVNCHVSPRLIKRLGNFDPVLVLKLGSDEKLRASLPAFTVYMFGTEQLYVYTQYLDLVTGKIFYEGVNEYFYEDVVGVTSGQEVQRTYKRHGFFNLFLKTIEYLKETVNIITSGGTHKESYIVDLGKSLIDTNFVGMRNLIRDKKQSR